MEDTERLLKSWDMPDDVIASFKKNEIYLQHFEDILKDDHYLKELCSTVGTRITLKNKITEYIDSKAITESACSLQVTEEVSFGNNTTNNEDHSISFSFTDLFVPSSFPDFDLKTLLNTSPCGKSILHYYSTNKGLDGKRRNRLTDIIIRHLFTFIVNKRLTYEDYNVLTSKIIAVFPKESPGTYFTRPIRKCESGTGKSVAARGKLVDKVRNILFQSCERKRPEQKNTDKKIVDPTILDLHSADIHSLNSHGEPWALVNEKWLRTFNVRHELNYDNVENFIKHWKVLEDPRAAELIKVDFSLLFPGKEENIKNWNAFFDKFVCLKRHEILLDDTKEKIFTSMNNVESEDTKFLLQLKLLINTLPPKGRASKRIKFSTQECIDSVMVLVENPGDIQTKIEDQKNKAALKKIQVQPYLIVLGTLENIRQIYLVIDKLRYTFDSAQIAFDVLFKSFHVLNAKYPNASEHIHLIIQRCIYKIVTKFDKPAPFISDILDLEK